MVEKISNRIKIQYCGRRDYSRENIFVIGLSKTGTTSMCEALNHIGYNSIHFPPIMKLNGSEIIFDWPWYLEKYNAFGDIPVSLFYKKLDKLYPNSKFILTYREKNSWLESAEKHFSVPSRDQIVAVLHEKLYGSDVFNHKKFSNSYSKHYNEVIDFFKNKKNFLIFDIYEGDSWGKLCLFLNRPTPSISFPRSNSRRYLSESEILSITKTLKLPKNYTKYHIELSYKNFNLSKYEIKLEILSSLLLDRESGHPNVIGHYIGVFDKLLKAK